MKSKLRAPVSRRQPLTKFIVLVLVILTVNETFAATPRPLRIAYLFTSGTMASMWMAKESGGFAKEGLDVEMISMSSVLALPALIANEVDVIQISAVPLINASLRGFDAIFVAGLLNTMIWDLYARAGDQERRATERQNRRHRPAGQSGGVRHIGSAAQIGTHV